MIRIVISWILLLLVFSVVAVTLCVTHAIMRLLHAAGFHYNARMQLIRQSRFSGLLLRLWGTRIQVENSGIPIDPARPVLFVASHHSSLDICLLTNYLSTLTGPKVLSFIARQGLDRGLPGISFYQRLYGYSLRGRTRHSQVPAAPDLLPDEQALPEFAKQVNERGDALVIFPEGVKRVTEPEHCRPFRRKGLRLLLTHMPDAQIISVGIVGTRNFYTTPRRLKDLRHCWPRFGQHLKMQVLPPLKNYPNKDIEATIDFIEQQIFDSYEYLRNTISQQPMALTLSSQQS